MDLSIGDYVELDQIPVPIKTGGTVSRVIDPWKSSDDFFHAVELPIDLQPQTRLLSYSVPRVKIPKGHVGLITLRSTWARLGLLSPMTIADPEFEGFLTMETINMNASPIRIRQNDSIWSITIVPAPEELSYTGRYQDQDASVILPRSLSHG